MNPVVCSMLPAAALAAGFVPGRATVPWVAAAVPPPHRPS
ncbi:hypothetical protein GA0070560_102455 [Micromonospora halophytica]|uniref:Uncharacterized protein n=1 Tax=Micromonospora halophytica TaxID=47864 RepID=A0A1C5H144_9ACTN|nr:hypothetical protein GA0070560_102455 [Micromonospora halophytica]